LQLFGGEGALSGGCPALCVTVPCPADWRK